MKKLTVSISLFLVLFGGHASANICPLKAPPGHPTVDVKNDVDFFQQLFPDSSYWGDRSWNEIVVGCNRFRDTKGNEIARITGSGNLGDKGTLLSADLEPKVIRGHYNFFSKITFQQKYVYVLRREKGVWIITIPYRTIINDLVAGRVDFLIGRRPIDATTGALGAPDSSGNASKVYDGSQVIDRHGAFTLKTGAHSIAETLCTTTTFFEGKEHEYDGQNDADAYRRDPENQFISLGKLQYGYKKSDDHIWEGCRVDKDQILYWRPDPGKPTVLSTTAQDFIIDNFERVATGYWQIPGVFKLELLLKGRNESKFSTGILNLLREDDRLTANFATKFPPFEFNQMYKSNPLQYNNFSTMTKDVAYHHEVGHAFGLDDEYAQFHEFTDPDGCENPTYIGMSSTYIMCVVQNLGSGNEMRTVYPYIAVSRYITKQSECDSDSDCGSGRYCDAGVDLDKNQCVALKPDNSACALVDGGHQCQSGHCDLGHCFTPGSVAMGGTCFNDAACAAGKCSSIDGTKGSCVCKTDGDCSSSQYCDAGVDLTKNKCVALKTDNSACALVDGGHQCQSGHCDLGHCFTPGSVAMGGTCFNDAACAAGKCSSIDGTKGSCVCKNDADCGSGKWCDAGADFTTNACRNKLNAGASCGKVGSVGNDHKCKSDQCSGFPDYVCK